MRLPYISVCLSPSATTHNANAIEHMCVYCVCVCVCYGQTLYILLCSIQICIRLTMEILYNVIGKNEKVISKLNVGSAAILQRDHIVWAAFAMRPRIKQTYTVSLESNTLGQKSWMHDARSKNFQIQRRSYFFSMQTKQTSADAVLAHSPEDCSLLKSSMKWLWLASERIASKYCYVWHQSISSNVLSTNDSRIGKHKLIARALYFWLACIQHMSFCSTYMRLLVACRDPHGYHFSRSKSADLLDNDNMFGYRIFFHSEKYTIRVWERIKPEAILNIAWLRSVMRVVHTTPEKPKHTRHS